MAVHRFRIWGGGGGAQTSAQLKCVWARNVFGRQRKILTFLDNSYNSFYVCYGVTFSRA